MAADLTPADRKPLTKREARLYARIYAAAHLLSVEPAWFDGLSTDEAELIEDALTELSVKMYEGDTISDTQTILNQVLKTRQNNT